MPGKRLFSLLLFLTNIIWYASLGAAVILPAIVVSNIFFPDLPLGKLISNFQLLTPELKISFQPMQGVSFASQRILYSCQTSLLIPILIMVLIITFHLKNLLKAFQAGNTFSTDNSRRLNWIGYTLIIGVLFKTAVCFGAAGFIAKFISFPGMECQPVINPDWLSLFGGVIIIIVAHFFKIGAELNTEKEFTV